MYIKLWGTRGSLPCSGPETIEYGGETPCIELRDSEDDDHIFVLDAGSGIRKLGMQSKNIKRADILLTHLHLDHIQGLGFFWAFDESQGRSAHLWAGKHGRRVACIVD